jgi:hypothetical protein
MPLPKPLGLLRHGVGGLTMVVALLLAASSAQAAPFTVTTLADSGAGSLRAAITSANAAAGADTISFTVSGTIGLGSSLPTITDSLAISGPGQGQLTVSGSNTFQPFFISSGPVVSISGLTISGGRCDLATCAAGGGALYNAATLTLSGVTITGNSATDTHGGGIYNAGTMTLDGSTVSSNGAGATGGNNSSASGGGIYNSGTMAIVLSTITANGAGVASATNQASALGGGIFNADTGQLTIDRSTVSSNSATAATGGGMESNALGGAINNRHNLTITRSTISGNTVSGTGGTAANSAVGGAISNVNPASPSDVSVTLDRTTVAGNTVTSPGTNQGGAIVVYPGSYTIQSSTLAHNSAAAGANIYFGSTTGTTVRNTIVAYPAGGGSNCSGAAAVTSFDVSSDGTCAFGGTGDHLNTDPLLAATRAANGGPTETYALQAGSPAIDQGQHDVGETNDQRGLARPSDFGAILNAPGGDGSDVGAFEVQDTVAPDTVLANGPAEGSTITERSPVFEFSSTEPGSRLECALDSGSFSACTSPHAPASLTDGLHTFYVRAVDAAGNADPTAATRSFSVAATAPEATSAPASSGPADGTVIQNPSLPVGIDTIAPQTTITMHPPRRTRSRRPTFQFRASETAARFQCRLDRRRFAPCRRSFRPARRLSIGRHVLDVRAIDAAGNVDSTPATFRFRVLR